MPRYHFHVVDGVTSDKNGIDLVDFGAAQRHAIRLRKALRRNIRVSDNKGGAILELRLTDIYASTVEERRL